MLSRALKHDLIRIQEAKLIKYMQTRAERTFNPYKYHLSIEAKKRLRWMYILYNEQDNNVTKTANKIGVSR